MLILNSLFPSYDIVKQCVHSGRYFLSPTEKYCFSAGECGFLIWQRQIFLGNSCWRTRSVPPEYSLVAVPLLLNSHPLGHWEYCRCRVRATHRSTLTLKGIELSWHMCLQFLFFVSTAYPQHYALFFFTFFPMLWQPHFPGIMIPSSHTFSPLIKNFTLTSHVCSSGDLSLLLKCDRMASYFYLLSLWQI
jgi:hypothetical protein